jgi:ubiquinone/menaquinone biosynthesis C-methylase UbiE
MFTRGGPTFLELARQALSSTERGYDLLAPKFELTPFRTPSRALAAARPYLGEARVERALDLCCGTGAAFELLATVADTLIGIDASAGMLEEARRRWPTAKLVRGDALSLPFGAKLDLVTCFGAFGHILEEDEPRLVEEIARVLRPGGRFVFYSAEPPPFWSARALAARAFNAAMRVRNWLWQPPFVMFYLTFLIPRARALLEARGFRVEVFTPVLDGPWAGLKLVVATKSPLDPGEGEGEGNGCPV